MLRSFPWLCAHKSLPANSGDHNRMPAIEPRLAAYKENTLFAVLSLQSQGTKILDSPTLYGESEQWKDLVKSWMLSLAPEGREGCVWFRSKIPFYM